LPDVGEKRDKLAKNRKARAAYVSVTQPDMSAMIRKADCVLFQALDRIAETRKTGCEKRCVLCKADTHEGLDGLVVRSTEGRARRHTHARAFHQIARECEAVGHAVDIEEAVKRTFRPDPA